MDGSKTHQSGQRAKDKPRPPTLVDHEIRALGGTTTAFDPEDIRAAKGASTSREQRLVELTRENGRLRQEIAYYRDLLDGVVMPLMPVLQYHVSGAHSVVRQCNAKIEQANARWELENGQDRSGAR